MMMYVNCHDLTARCRIEHKRLSALFGDVFPTVIAAWVQMIEDVSASHGCKPGQAVLGLVADLHARDHVNGPAAGWLLAALWECSNQQSIGAELLRDAQDGGAC